MRWRDRYIAVDWGTTNRRAWRVGAGGRVEEAFEDDLGVTTVPEGGFDAAVSDLRARLGDHPMLLAGMIGSNRGWRAAPYVPCPAGPADLARAMLWVQPGYTGIVPGVSQTAPPDVMRGEEVQVFGAIAMGRLAPDGLVCHPGTHAKWIRLAGGRIATFRTCMTGELFALLGQHSILAAQLEGPVRPGAAFDAGVAAAFGGTGLLSGLFAVRARQLLDPGPAEDSACHASGLLIGTDVREGLALGASDHVVLVGRPDLSALYAAAIAQAGGATGIVDGRDAFLAGIHLLTEML